MRTSQPHGLRARYRACGRVTLPYAPTPVYARNVSCSVAVAVVKGCSSVLSKGGCFGESAVPSIGGQPALPEEEPAWKPLGFDCFQTSGRATAGIPPPPRNFHDPKQIVCSREARLTGTDAVIVLENVAYVV